MKCPAFEQLISYLSGDLADAESAAIASHLDSGCLRCAEQRAWFDQISQITATDDLAEPPAWVVKRAIRIPDVTASRPKLTERLTQLIASLVFDSFAGAAPIGVRSAAAATRQLLYQADDYGIDLQVAPSLQSGADLIGQILRKGEDAFDSVNGLPLTLSREGNVVESTATDEMGGFAIHNLSYGSYDLQIDLPGGSIIISGLPVAGQA
jgi:hypothetical protein